MNSNAKEKTMKNFIIGISMTSVLLMTLSCTNDDSSETELESNCYVCSVDIGSLDVCIEEDGDFTVEGDTVPNPNNVSLADFISAIEANPNNDPALEGISCSRK